MAQNLVQYQKSKIIDYKIGIENKTLQKEFSTIINLSKEAKQKLIQDFPCDEYSLFLAIQTQEMRNHAYKGMPWNFNLLNENDINSKVICSATRFNFLSLIQQGLGKIYDDMLTAGLQTSSFAIYARRDGYTEIAGLVTGIKENKNSPITYLYAVNPEWKLGKHIETSQSR
ncbi:MAG: hypothetical protein J6C13_01105 [Clostridia bacterium]|nr:hypothetical protein [Clostridia bacterium]